MAIVEVDKLTKRYRGAATNAVDGVSFAIEQGEFFALLGPNGAGKTTIISILTTTLAPTSGSVRISDHDLRTEASKVRRQVGIIFQKPSLDLNLTAEENVRFHTVLYGLYPFRPTFALMPRTYREQVRELARILGIEDALFKPIKTFSGGMHRKLEIIRSLMHRPRVLFLDEPTLGLDPFSRRSLWEYLVEVRASSGTTVLLTTHYLEEAEGADRICVLDKGRIAAYGTPDQLKAQLLEHYVLLDAGDRSALEAELRQLNVPFKSRAQVKVRVQPDEVHGLLRQIQTPLNVVKTVAPTLEDAYMEIVGRPEDNGA
jgi:ABC-2 type transport system ATP-binding protein